MKRNRIRRLFRLPPSESTLERDIEEEIEFHIEARTGELVRSGEDAAAARSRAEREFGSLAAARAELRSIGRLKLRQERRAARLAALRQDTGATWAAMRRRPGFAAAVVVTLGLGIGVNAAMFAITDRLLLQAPPHIEGADDLARVLVEYTPRGGEQNRTGHLPYPAYTALRSVGAFEEMGALGSLNAVLGRGEASSEIRLGQATATLFPMLGVRPVLGRFFSEEEDALPRGVRVAVLSHALWQREFGGDPGVVGTVVEINHRPYEVIGVAPRGFTGVGLEPIHAWVPVSALGPDMAGDEWYAFQGMHYLQVVARLADGVEAGAAQEEAAAMFRASYENGFIGDPEPSIILGSIIPARAPAIGDGGPQRSGRVALWLLGVSVLVVIIACVNVINLLLARGMRHRREIGVRLALGVGRGRLMAQTAVETLLLALLGAALGLALAHWVGNLVRVLLLPDSEWPGMLVNGRVAGFAALVAVACALGASILPALHAVRTPVTTLLAAGARSTYRRSRTRTGLVALQAALSLLLLSGAGLFLRSLGEAGRIPLGYEPDRVAVLSWHTAGLDWERERVLGLYETALERVRAMPQVEAAALSMTQPLWGTMFGYVRVPGLDSIPTNRDILYSSVSPGYFRTVGARLIQGREFTPDDRAGNAPVAIVTSSLARTLWPGEDALGKCFRTSTQAEAVCREVVGVVEETRYRDVLDDPSLMYYLPLAQDSGRGWMGGLLVRLAAGDRSGLAAVRSIMQTLEPALPHVKMTPLIERVSPVLRPWRVGAWLFSGFGVLALVLASIGLYGVVTYEVAQRRRELGVRAALGARAADLVRMVVGDALRVVGLGVVLGLIVVGFAARFFEPVLFRVSASDPTVHGGVAVLLVVISLLAALVPAWRAARVQPTEALREE